jgi:Zn-dependent M28 family amino/carboxypeptidase
MMIAFVICLKSSEGAAKSMIDIQKTVERLQHHLRSLTRTIGERSVLTPENLKRAANYVESFYREIGLTVHNEPYRYEDFTVANVVAEIAFCANPSKHYLLGAHYDSVSGTVGADDNASAIAVQLETARHLQARMDHEELDLAVKFVSFALEEPPVFGARHMGSRVYARRARKDEEKIDGMICLEMVGYTCHDPGCQDYPFPLMFLGYPKEGDFIGLVGNFKSRNFTNSLFRAFQQNPELPVVKLTVPLGGWLMPSVRLSDHSSFWDQGFKAVMITDSSFYRNPHYHLASDTMETLDYRFMAELVESLIVFFVSQHR